jgi:hypothetical protein
MPKKIRTRWTIPQTIAVGNTYQTLLATHLQRFADRGIDASFASNFSALLGDLAAAQSGQTVRRQQQTGATQAVLRAIATIAQETNGIRANIRRRFPGRKDLHKTFGSGIASGKSSNAIAIALADSILDAIASYPSETAAARIIQRDIDAVLQARAALLAADLAQEGLKGSRISATAAKDHLHRQVIALIDEVLGAAEMEFSAEPEILALYRGPLPTRKPQKSKPAAA